MVTIWPGAQDIEEADLRLGDEVGSGGQGRVFRVHNAPYGIVYKQFRSAGANSGALELLVGFPTSLPAGDRDRLLRQSAWPRARVTHQGQLTGFLMQQVPDRFYARSSAGVNKARELQYLIYERKPAWGDIAHSDVSAATRIEVAGQFAALADLLHSKSLVIGDVSMSNVLWAPGDPPSVMLIDCDGIRQLGSSPVLPQAETPEWNDPHQPQGGPDLDTDRYKLALLVGRVLCKSPYIRPGEPLQPVPDLPVNVALAVDRLWARAAGPRGDRPHAREWAAALAGELLEARMLNERYRLIRRLGSGGMGSVWEALDTRLNRTVAIKELVSGAQDAEDRAVRKERLQREALALAQVSHPVVAGIHDLIYTGRRQDPWIVMEYIPGRPLSSLISEAAPLREREVAQIGLSVLSGLMACHAHDVFHRDVKPANIVLSEDGSVRLVDFGTARIGRIGSRIAEGAIVGTPEFLAPELLSGEPPGPGTDLWALGVTLYYALEGRSPFRAEATPATIAAILSRNPPAPRSGGTVAALVLDMLSKDPAGRPKPVAVASALQLAAAGDAAAQVPLPQEREEPGAAALLSGKPSEGTGAQQRDRPPLVLAPLAKMPASEAAGVVAGWPTDRATASLLALGEDQAAQIINRCEDTAAGALLASIASRQPDKAGEILEMLGTERAGLLLDFMSTAASALALSQLPSTRAARILARARDGSAAGALLEMDAANSASIIQAMDVQHATKLLSRMPPAALAEVLQRVPPDLLRILTDSLPKPIDPAPGLSPASQPAGTSRWQRFKRRRAPAGGLLTGNGSDEDAVLAEHYRRLKEHAAAPGQREPSPATAARDRRSAVSQREDSRHRRHTPGTDIAQASQPDDVQALPRNASRASKTNFLNSLTTAQRQAFASVAREIAFDRGAILMQENDPADHVLVITSGWTRVTSRQGDGERLIAERGPGQLLGERGALRVGTREATVTALSPVRVLMMSSEDFASFISAHPSVLDIVEDQIYERLTLDPGKRQRHTPDAQRGTVAPDPAASPGQTLAGENCTVLNTDVVGFGSLGRTDHDRRIIRLAGRDLLRECLGQAWDECVIGDQGDGLLIVVPPSVPTGAVIESLHRELPGRLRRHNATFHESARIRLRLAINVGPVTSDNVGISGDAIIRTARLIDAPALRNAMSADGAALGIIVSGFVYDTAIKNSTSWVHASEYKPVKVRVKESSFSGWLRLIDLAPPDF